MTYREEPKSHRVACPLHGICTATVTGETSAVVVRLRLNDNAASVEQGPVPAIQMTHLTSLNTGSSGRVGAPCLCSTNIKNCG